MSHQTFFVSLLPMTLVALAAACAAPGDDATGDLASANLEARSGDPRGTWGRLPGAVVALPEDLPSALASAVWTGKDVLVWDSTRARGLRYGEDPRCGSGPITCWVPMATRNAPSPRNSETALWTGTELIVYGGHDAARNETVGSGGRYDPSTDTWTALPLSVARERHTAVWTGESMLVWGGESHAGYYPPSNLTSGFSYSPKSNAWTWIEPQTQRIYGRFSHSAVWTGTDMIVWGGIGGYRAGDAKPLQGGAILTGLPTPSWQLAASGMEGRAAGNAAIWTGTEMLVWGGVAQGVFPPGYDPGVRFDPKANAFRYIRSDTGAPPQRAWQSVVWTGSEMIVWGGFADGEYANTGAIYSPTTDTWTAMTTEGAPTLQYEGRYATVWAGTRFVAYSPYGSYAYVP
jgi:hypothetical protein